MTQRPHLQTPIDGVQHYWRHDLTESENSLILSSVKRDRVNGQVAKQGNGSGQQVASMGGSIGGA